MCIIQCDNHIVTNMHRRGDYIRWVEQLPDSQTPSWLGLPNNAEKVLLTKRGKACGHY